MLSPDKGAETALYVATSPNLEGVSGKYFAKKQETQSSKESYNEEERKKLWDISMKLLWASVKFPQHSWRLD